MSGEIILIRHKQSKVAQMSASRLIGLRALQPHSGGKDAMKGHEGYEQTLSAAGTFVQDMILQIAYQYWLVTCCRKYPLKSFLYLCFQAKVAANNNVFAH